MPTGNTEFQFQAGNLNFTRPAYEWLVVNQNGTNAQFKGTGTVNGALDPNGSLQVHALGQGRLTGHLPHQDLVGSCRCRARHL